MKVLWLTNIPSPYRVDFFNELGKYCELTVLFEKESTKEREQSWLSYNAEHFKAIYLKGTDTGLANAFCPSVLKYISNKWDHIVVSNAADPTGILAIAYMRTRKIPYEIEGDGAFPGKTFGLRSLVKRICYKGAQLCFSTAKLHDEYYLQYGVEPSRIVRYPFSSVYEKEVLITPMSQKEKRNLRDALGIEESYMILSVGRFIYGKGYDILIQVAAQLETDCGVYIVGGEPTEEYELLKSQMSVQNVHFISFKQPEELQKYYRAADVFVHPTRKDVWGLVVNEAMAQGLPVVSTDRCIAGLEMIIDKKNGIVVEAENAEQTAEAIRECIFHQDTMSIEACNTAKKYTIEKMVQYHLDIWKGLVR